MHNNSQTNNDRWIKRNCHALIVTIFSIIVCLSLIYLNNTSNILGRSYRDVFLYLILALRFSGYSISGYEYVNYLSPLIPFLTSIFFRLSFISELTLFSVTGIFYPIATIGMFYLLNLRFDKNISLLGAILYGACSINLIWSANGTLDIPSIALSIWALYCFILAMEKNQKYFYLAFPLAVLSFLAKFPGALIFAIFATYFLSKRDIFTNIKKYFRHGIGGIAAGALFVIPVFYYYQANNIPFGFLNQAGEISARTTTSAAAIAKHTTNQLFYYIEYIPRFFQNNLRFIMTPQKALGYIVIIIGLIGLIYGIYKFSTCLREHYRKSDEKIGISFLEDYKGLILNNDNLISLFNNFKLKKEAIMGLMILSLIAMALSFLTASKISFVESEMIFFASVLIFSICFNSIFKDLSELSLFSNDGKNNGKYKYFNYDLAMIAWFMGYMIFFSAHLTKADRYFIAFAPSFIFFITYSADIILKGIEKLLYKHKCSKSKTCKRKCVKSRIPTVIIAICILLLFASTADYFTIDKHDPLVDNEKDASQWIVENVPDYENITIWADRGPIYTWYLKTNIEYRTETVEMSKMGDYLNERNASYYISTPWNSTIDGFTKLKSFGDVNIYKNDRLVK